MYDAMTQSSVAVTSATPLDAVRDLIEQRKILRDKLEEVDRQIDAIRKVIDMV